MFTAHAERDGPLRLIPHRFTWAGLWFGPLWLLAQRLWWPAAAVAAIGAMLILAARWGAISAGAAELAWLLLSVLIGLEGQELRRRALLRRSAPLSGFAYGHDEAEALAREAFRAASGRTAS